MNNKQIAKQTVKLINHVPGKQIKKGDSTFIEPCPICGHNEHFVINESKNLYMSYSKCCNGGSIIDWFMEYEKLSLSESIKKCISFAGLNDDKPNKDQQRKTNEAKKKELEKKQILDLFKNDKENLVNTIIMLIPIYRNENKISKKERIIMKCYHKLTIIERALRKMKDKSVFLRWLLSFIDGYTMRYITASNEEEMYKLCLDFKQELHYSYMNFCSYEQDLIEIVGKTDELKLLSGGIRNDK